MEEGKNLHLAELAWDVKRRPRLEELEREVCRELRLERRIRWSVIGQPGSQMGDWRPLGMETHTPLITVRDLLLMIGHITSSVLEEVNSILIPALVDLIRLRASESDAESMLFISKDTNEDSTQGSVSCTSLLSKVNVICLTQSLDSRSSPISIEEPVKTCCSSSSLSSEERAHSSSSQISTKNLLATWPRYTRPQSAKPPPAKPPSTKPPSAKPPSDKPSPAKPSPAKPPSDKPSPAKPSPAKPPSDKPSPAKPPSDKPSPAKPSPAKPPSDKPSPAKPSPAKPPSDKPPSDKPPPAKPSPAKPSPAKPSPAKPPSAKPPSAKPPPAKPPPAKLRSAKPQSGKPPPAKLRSAKPQSAKPPPAKLRSAKPQAAKPLLAKLQSAKPPTATDYSGTLSAVVGRGHVIPVKLTLAPFSSLLSSEETNTNLPSSSRPSSCSIKLLDRRSDIPCSLAVSSISTVPGPDSSRSPKRENQYATEVSSICLSQDRNGQGGSVTPPAPLDVSLPSVIERAGGLVCSVISQSLAIVEARSSVNGGHWQMAVDSD
ncbi:nucleolar protein dao-5-like isoform X2 [Salvelinus fontinalis]|nr:nucleolar protein dao-5-like isoform X2 [Salvelinus fontinalis]